MHRLSILVSLTFISDHGILAVSLALLLRIIVIIIISKLTACQFQARELSVYRIMYIHYCLYGSVVDDLCLVHEVVRHHLTVMRR